MAVLLLKQKPASYSLYL